VNKALERLEYRGYDSSGIALLEDGRIFVDKKVGKIRELIKSLWGKELNATTGTTMGYPWGRMRAKRPPSHRWSGKICLGA
jgi:glucosamine 6-phosphate synthetase-like amidotransferase/phosphosugar isomerase protein